MNIMHPGRIQMSTWAAAVMLAMAAPALPADLRTGFEGAAPGAITRLESGIGVWSADKEHARIDAEHHRGGEQCLHLLGGDGREVIVDLEGPTEGVTELDFWCERWTRRDPFEFRVDAFDGADWQEAYRGDDEVRIGTFKSHVRFTVRPGTSRLRFRCTSPAGVLIDDVALTEAVPMTLSSVTASQEVVPCLVRNRVNRVVEVTLVTSGSLEPLVLKELQVSLEGTTDLKDIKSVEIVGPGEARFGGTWPPAMELIFQGKHVLAPGESEFAVSVVLAPEANIDNLVNARVVSVTLEDAEPIVPDPGAVTGPQRMGIALRDAGDDGSAGYRIPGITTTSSGALIAVYDVRWKGLVDLPGDIDVGMSRSLDGGRTWEPMRVILDMGSDPKFQYDGVGDPSILYDPVGETIWVATTWSHGNRAWRGSGPGLTPDETGQLLLTRSDDDGVTWSSPINITAEVKRPEWCYLLQGPGRGICMEDGTLVFAAQYQDTEARGRVPHSTILFSRDRGKTWALGSAPRPNTTEAQVAEVGDGTLMLNMRDNRGGSRAIYTTRDLGETWAEHPTSRSALVEPVCNAALLRIDGSRLAFINPAVPKPPRRRMTLKLSPDAGATWPEAQQLLLDAGQSAGYPSATMIDPDHIGVLFEGSAAQLTFMRIPLSAARD